MVGNFLVFIFELNLLEFCCIWTFDNEKIATTISLDDDKHLLEIKPVLDENEKEIKHVAKRRSLVDNSAELQAIRRKRSVNGQPISTVVEYLVVADDSFFSNEQMYLSTNDVNKTIQFMKVHFAYVVAGVRDYSKIFWAYISINIAFVQNICLLHR